MDSALLFSTIGGLLASTITKAITHKVKKLHPIVEVLLFGTVAFIGVALQWGLTGGASHLVGYDIIAQHWADVVAVGTFIYQFVVRPAYKALYPEAKEEIDKLTPAPIDVEQDFEETPVAGLAPATVALPAADILPGEASF